MSNVIPMTVYLCKKCNCGYRDAESAEKCCGQRFCVDCGVEVARYRAHCGACVLKFRFEKAEKVALADYTGWLYSEEISGYNEGYFEDLESLRNYCYDNDIPVPDWVFCCIAVKNELNIDSAIESMLEEAYEDARDHLVDEQELYYFVEEWNAKQTIVSYYPDYKRVVVLGNVGV